MSHAIRADSVNHSWDLIVVGAGVAGWTAARRAQQLGVEVIVLEKHTSGPGWGNGRLSGGWYHAAKESPHRPQDHLYERLIAIAGGYSRPELARAWAANVERALEFLKSEGGVFAPIGRLEIQENVAQPPRPSALGRDWKDKGPDRILNSMWSRFRASGGTFRAGRRAIELVTDHGKIVGVAADTGGVREIFKGRKVLLCDGGFQANPELVAKYITREYKLRGSVSDTGDALKMGLGVGAKTVNMEWFYGHCLARDSLRNDDLWPGFGARNLISAGAVVNGYGNRFADEGLGDEIMADRISKSETPGGCWVIFDDDVWESIGRAGGQWPINPCLQEQGGTVVSSDTLQDLADEAGISVTPLVMAIQSFNAHQRDRRLALSPPRTGSEWPAIARAPFHAIPLIAGITFAMGGLLVNRDGQVLDENEKVIDGLYAAGGTMGGLQGGPEVGYAGGWSEATCFGLLAAEHIAKSLHWTLDS